MGDEDEGHAVPGELEDDVEDFTDHLGIEGCRHLIEKDDFWLHHECSHDGRALLLAARELTGQGGSSVEQPDAVK